MDEAALECGSSLPLSPAERVQGGTKLPHSKVPWPHAPVHRLSEAGTYIVTAGTYHKKPFFHDGPLLRMLHQALLTIAVERHWRLEAWAVFPNHYHFVAHSPADADSLVAFLTELHSRTAIAVNRHNRVRGRKIWHNYWETRLTHERSYLARLHYVHHNPVRHGLVGTASDYPWGSAAWFERTATPAQLKTVYTFKIDRINVPDDF